MRGIAGPHRLLGVSHVEIDRLVVDEQHIKAAGKGSFDIDMQASDPRGLSANVGLPLAFEAVLDHGLSILSLVPNIDVASLYDFGL